jgi:hypothetical protein
MVQRRDRARLALESIAELLRGDLNGDIGPSRESLARQTSPIPPCPRRDRISYGPRRSPVASVIWSEFAQVYRSARVVDSH